MTILAFDPGKRAGWAAFDSTIDGYLSAYGYVATGRKEDHLRASAVSDLLDRFSPHAVVVEKPTTHPRDGRVGAFKYGMSCGVIVGCVVGASIALEIVRPQDWKAVVLKGTAKDKDAALDYVNNRFQVNLRDTEIAPKGDGHNVADAICIGEYGRRTLA